MQIKIKIGKETPGVGILEKLSLVLFGTFTTSLLFAILIKYLEKAGIWLGIFLTLIIVFCGFYYIEKGTRLRLITWGILGTIVVFSGFLIFAIFSLSKALEGI